MSLVIEHFGHVNSSLKEMISCGQSYLDYNVEERPEYIEKYEELVNEVGTTEGPQIEKVIEPDLDAASS